MPALKNLMRTFARYATTAAVANLCPSTMRHGSVETMQPATGWLPMLLMALLVLIAILLGLYTARHYLFTLNRLFARQRSLYADIEASQWPRLTVFIAAHNEEAVVGDCIASLLAADYPRDRLVIMPVNDRSTDGTRHHRALLRRESGAPAAFPSGVRSAGQSRRAEGCDGHRDPGEPGRCHPDL
jgi:hypothetical protein